MKDNNISQQVVKGSFSSSNKSSTSDKVTATTTTTTESIQQPSSFTSPSSLSDNNIYPEKQQQVQVQQTIINYKDHPRTIDEFLQQAYDETSSSSSKRSNIRWKYWLSFWSLGIANCGDATEIGCLNYILSYEEFQNDILDGGDLSYRGALLTSSVYAGMLIGGLITGAVFGDQGGQYGGRKVTCIFGLCLNSISGIISALSPNVYVMCLCRFIGGLGVGAVLSSLIAFATEISPSNQRGLFVTFVASFWTLGSITVSLLAYFILGVRESSWRIFMLSCAIPSILGIICVTLFVPESPRFLALHGKLQQALINANYYAIDGMNYHIPLTIDEIHHHYGSTTTTSKSKQTSSLSSSSSSCGVIWKKAYQNIKHLYESKELRRYHTIPLQIIWFCMSFGSGLCIWINTMFTKIGISNVYGSAILFALANIPGNIISAMLLDRIGRKTMLIGSMIGCTLCLWIFAFAAHGAMSYQEQQQTLLLQQMRGAIPMEGGGGGQVVHNNNARPVLGGDFTVLVVASACIFHSFLVCTWCSISCMTGESFPTSIRSTGMGICAASGRISAIFVQFVNGQLIDTPSILLMVSSIVILVGASCPWCLNIPDLSKQPLKDTTTTTTTTAAGTCMPSALVYKKSDGDENELPITTIVAGADEGEVV